jgi:hypothetical protein
MWISILLDYLDFFEILSGKVTHNFKKNENQLKAPIHILFDLVFDADSEYDIFIA